MEEGRRKEEGRGDRGGMRRKEESYNCALSYTVSQVTMTKQSVHQGNNNRRKKKLLMKPQVSPQLTDSGLYKKTQSVENTRSHDLQYTLAKLLGQEYHYVF